MRSPALPAVSLFANCGAGDVGYARAGFRFQTIAELQPSRIQVASLNHPEAKAVPGDLRETWPDVVAAYRARLGDLPPALLAACPPCQGMSSAQQNRGHADDADAGSRDTRNLLVDVVASVAEELRPRTIVVENVVAFLTRKVRHPRTGEPIAAARLLIDRLLNDYHPFAFRTDLADFGVPQTRKRAFLVLVRRDEPGLSRLHASGRVPFPSATHGPGTGRARVTLRQALEEYALPTLDAASATLAGEGMHAVPVWDERRYSMVAAIPRGTGRSAWENAICAVCGPVDATADDALCPSCQTPLPRPLVPEDGGWRLINGFRNSSYRRMTPDRPAATVTTASGRIGSDNTLHPFENRVLSALECQLLQTIPADFKWTPTLGLGQVREMIGEAVPPQFTHLHGQVLASLLRGRVARASMTTSDARVVAALERLDFL